MSTQLVFIYDYHLAKNVISNICCTKFKRFKKAILEDVALTFRGKYSQGYLTVERGGNDKVYGVVYKIQDKDIDRLQQYMELHYKTKKVKVKVYTGKRNFINALMFVPESKMKFMIPDIRYYNFLRIAYDEVGFDTEMLDKALKRTIKQIYYKMTRETNV